jgi:MFS family permease
MTEARWETASVAEPETAYWMRNMVICLVGSFTTIVAMTLLLPFLPIYVEELGVTDKAAVVEWSGIAYGATFFAAALVAPLADAHSRQPRHGGGDFADGHGRQCLGTRRA